MDAATKKALQQSIAETIVEPDSKGGELYVRLRVADVPLKAIDTASYHLQILTTISGTARLPLAKILYLVLVELQGIVLAQLEKLKAG